LHYMDLIAFVLNMEQPCEQRVLEDVFDLLAMEGWDEFWLISEEALNEEAEAIDLMTRCWRSMVHLHLILQFILYCLHSIKLLWT